MEFIKGDETILKVKLGTVGDFYPIACLTDNAFSESLEMIATTVRTNQNGWNSYYPGLQDYNISFSGIIPFKENSANYDYFDLTQKKRSRTILEWRIDFGNGKTFVGKGYINSLEHDAIVGEFTTFSGSIQGSGQVEDLAEQQADEYIERVEADGGNVIRGCTIDFINKLQTEI